MATNLLEAQERTLDHDHPHVLANRLNIGVWTAMTGRPLIAIVDLQALAEAYERLLGAEDSQTLRARGHIGCTLILAGYSDSGQILLREVVASMRRAVGENHPYLVEALEWLDDEWQ